MRDPPIKQYWGTYRDDRTSRLSHWRTFFSHLTVIIGKKLLSSFFSFTFKHKILQNLTSSQLTTWFSHDSQKTGMHPSKSLRSAKAHQSALDCLRAQTQPCFKNWNQKNESNTHGASKMVTYILAKILQQTYINLLKVCRTSLARAMAG